MFGGERNRNARERFSSGPLWPFGVVEVRKKGKEVVGCQRSEVGTKNQKTNHKQSLNGSTKTQKTNSTNLKIKRTNVPDPFGILGYPVPRVIEI
jgi:hypothetical protein